jgi:hypothetical protein
MMNLTLGNEVDEVDNESPERIEERKSELDEDEEESENEQNLGAQSRNQDLENRWTDMIQSEDRIQAFEPVLEGNRPDSETNINQPRDS